MVLFAVVVFLLLGAALLYVTAPAWQPRLRAWREKRGQGQVAAEEGGDDDR